MNYKTSRAWRNNNPLNIRRGEEWQGLVAKQNRTDRQFCQFLNQTWGYRAAAKLMKSYSRYFQQTGKPFDIITILNRWAPPSENDTAKYIDDVMRLMGREPHDWQLAPISTRPGQQQLALMMAAMTCIESGCPPQAVRVDSINIGFRLAGLGDPGLTPDWWR